jgi:hypothetical protein
VGDEIGLIAMVAFFLITLFAITKLIHAQRDGPGAVLISGMAAALPGLAVGAIFLHVWADLTVAMTAWALAGASLGLGETLPRPDETDEAYPMPAALTSS